MSAITFRNATEEDLPTLVRLLADDELGRARELYEEPLPDDYRSAFARIDGDPRQQLLVAVLEREVVGMLQLTTIPYLTYQGGTRALVEGVRVDGSHRGKGVGRALLQDAIQRARAAGCHVVQLTTDKRRPQALAFYEALGFTASHEGLKLHL